MIHYYLLMSLRSYKKNNYIINLNQIINHCIGLKLLVLLVNLDDLFLTRNVKIFQLRILINRRVNLLCAICDIH